MGCSVRVLLSEDCLELGVGMPMVLGFGEREVV